MLLQEIMSEARSLTDAERCSLFLLDDEKKELVAKVFDGQTNDQVSSFLFTNEASALLTKLTNLFLDGLEIVYSLKYNFCISIMRLGYANLLFQYTITRDWTMLKFPSIPRKTLNCEFYYMQCSFYIAFA